MNDNSFASSRNILNDLISQAPSIGIFIGGDQNLDKTAAGLGLFLSLSDLGKTVQVVSRKEPIVEISNLVGIDKIKREFEGSTKTLVISVPYRDGDIEKVSYNIEGDRLNVNLFAETNGINFSDQEIQFIKKGSSPSLVFVIGVSSQDKLSGVIDLSGAKIVNIDNNPANSLYGDLVFVDSAFSSTSEIISKILSELSLPFSLDVAQNLLDGLSRSTSDFSSQKTSPYAFEAAAFLLKHGARRQSKVRNEVRGQGGASFQRRQPQAQVQNQTEVRQSKPITQNQNFNNGFNEEDVPSDWFVPKVFKGQDDPNV